MQDLSTAMLNHEEAIEHLERHRWNREEIQCKDCFAVIFGETLASACWDRRGVESAEDIGPRSLHKPRSRASEVLREFWGLPNPGSPWPGAVSGRGSQP